MAPAISSGREPIAIVGIGCRFPGGTTPDAFWQMLASSTDAIAEVPDARGDLGSFFDPTPGTPGRMVTREGGFLTDLDKFDAAFFGISPREAVFIDPQQRLLLELAWEAFEDGGIVASGLAGSRTGVYVGMWTNEYQDYVFGSAPDIDLYVTTGTGRYSASGRLSYAFDLRGPSLTLDTACSSSLVAIHLAARSVWEGESQVALAAGVNLILQPHISIGYSRSRMLSPRARCRFGDATADGYVRSEGAGVIVLKPLAQALADGDRVRAVILGSAVNNDGRGSGLLVAPSAAGQQEMLREAYRSAGISPAAVQYVEAHGTGTRVGDPVELEALSSVLGLDRPAERPCRIGSVKTNIGHSEAASGMAGVIKTVLALEHGLIPANLHLEQPNPAIPWDSMPLTMVRERQPWPETDGLRLAGVNSFGITGTNAHVVLAEAPRASHGAADVAGPFVLPISAPSPDALAAVARAYAERLRSEAIESLPNLCYTAACRRTQHEYRATVVGRTPADFTDHLDALAVGESRAMLATGRAVPGTTRRVAFVFPGQGSQWLGMGRALMASESVFADMLGRCDAAVATLTGWSVIEQLQAAEIESRLAEIDVVQPVLFSVQVALTALWQSWGVEPEAVVGHSMGEVAAAHVAGALTLEDAARIICRRSALLRRTSGQGAMAVVELSIDRANDAIAGFEDRLSVAVSNSPRSTVLSGDPDALEALLQRLDQDGIFCRRVKVDVASHSPQMDPLRADLLTAIAAITPRACPVRFMSTVASRELGGEMLVPAYWVNNLRDPVLFSTTVRTLVDDGVDTFIEMSPHPLLVSAILENAVDAGREVLALSSGRRDDDEIAVARASAGALHCHGGHITWARLQSAEAVVVPLPAYPWQRERFWYDAPKTPHSGHTGTGDLLGEAIQASVQNGTWHWQFELTLDAMPYLRDHRVGGAIVVPAAWFVELAFDAAERTLGPVALERVRVSTALVLPDDGARTLQVTLVADDAGRGTIRIVSREPSDGARDRSWMEHVSAAVRVNPDQQRVVVVAAPSEPADASTERDPAAHYALMQRRGLDYGPVFRGVTRSVRQEDGLLASLTIPVADGTADERLRSRAAILDACFQAVVGALPESDSTIDVGDTFVPVEIQAFDVAGRPGAEPLSCRVTNTSSGDGGDSFTGDIDLMDAKGSIFLRARGVRLVRISRERDSHAREALYSLAWVAEPGERPAPSDGSWLIVGDPESVAEALAARLASRGAEVRVAAAEEGATLLDGGTPFHGVVLCGTVGRRVGAADTHLALKLARTLGRREGQIPRLWFVTAGTQSIPSSDAVVGELAAGALWGVRSVVDTEYPALRCSALDLGGSLSTAELDVAADELLAGAPSREVAIRGRERYGRRLRRGSPENHEPARRSPAAGRPFTAITTSPGILDGLAFDAMVRRAPTARQVEIEVVTAGVNFMNVMSALGVYPGWPEGVGPLGIECAGRIARVGADVTRFTIGDTVMAFAHDSLGSHAMADERLVAHIPDGVDFWRAATIPIAFLTAYYSLVHLARLSRDERVLIHSAAGGVGIAALQIAQRAGAKVYATAGTAEKRDWLRQHGIEHVFDSRSLTFVEGITQATCGEGVDVVLNSLAGDAIPAGLNLLRGGGRFVEIGKRDIYANRSVGLLPFQRNLSYFAVDLDRMARERPDLLGPLFQDTVAQFDPARSAAPLQALPLKVFQSAEIADAFRLMAQGGHTGKIVIAIDPDATPIQSRQTAMPRDWSTGTYLVTGGTGGLGLEVARWMVDQGARHIVLLARRGATPTVETALQHLRACGADVRVVAADVSSQDDVTRVVAEIDDTMPRLAGVVHAAGVLDDATIASLEPAQVDRVFAPKVDGAWHLHEATADRPLDFFVLFSSVTAFIGSGGQGNYAAANAALDMLAAYRRALGLPGQSIAWGPWADIGLAAARDDRGARLADRGLRSLAPSVGIAALAEALQSNPVHVAVMSFDPARWSESSPAAAGWPLFRDLLAERSGGAADPVVSTVGLRAQLEEVPRGRRRRALLESHLRQNIAQVLKMAPARVDTTKPLRTMGLDSLMGLELRNRLEATTGLALPATLVWNFPTVVQLATELAKRLEIELDEPSETDVVPLVSGDPSGTAGNDASLDVLLAEIEGLSDEDARRFLAEEH